MPMQAVIKALDLECQMRESDLTLRLSPSEEEVFQVLQHNEH